MLLDNGIQYSTIQYNTIDSFTISFLGWDWKELPLSWLWNIPSPCIYVYYLVISLFLGVNTFTWSQVFQGNDSSSMFYKRGFRHSLSSEWVLHNVPMSCKGWMGVTVLKHVLWRCIRETIEDIACGVCEALEYLHERGIAYRDLKLENARCSVADMPWQGAALHQVIGKLRCCWIAGLCQVVRHGLCYSCSPPEPELEKFFNEVGKWDDYRKSMIAGLLTWFHSFLASKAYCLWTNTTNSAVSTDRKTPEICLMLFPLALVKATRRTRVWAPLSTRSSCRP